MKKTSLFLYLIFIFSLVSCHNEHNHTYSEWQYDEFYHWRNYTCEHTNINDKNPHFDNDNNKVCDECSYVLTKEEENKELGTYHLNFNSNYDPISLTFENNGNCILSYNDDKKDKIYSYTVVNDKVILKLSNSDKSHIFNIYKNSLIFDKEASTANLWDSLALKCPVIYFSDNATIEEKLTTTVLVQNKTNNIPLLDKIYLTYEYNGSLVSNQIYAFSLKSDSTETLSDKILGSDYTFTYNNNSPILIYAEGKILSLNEAFDKGYITEEVLQILNENHHDCKISHSYNDGEIIKENGSEFILYTCIICKHNYKVDLPKDFSFTLTWSFDGNYDSKTSLLSNGYNHDLGIKCETTLVLEHDELMNIYRMLYNANILNIKEDIIISDDLMEPNYHIKFGYKIDDIEYKFNIYGVNNKTYSDWNSYYQFGYAYYEILNNYILSSEEFKSLPPNQNIYE